MSGREVLEGLPQIKHAVLHIYMFYESDVDTSDVELSLVPLMFLSKFRVSMDA